MGYRNDAHSWLEVVQFFEPFLLSKFPIEKIDMCSNDSFVASVTASVKLNRGFKKSPLFDVKGGRGKSSPFIYAV